MALKNFNPTSPGRRFMTHLTYDELTKSTPEKSLTEPLRKTGGRDNRGRITVRFIGGGHKQRYRKVDFKRDKTGIPAKVAAVEYDPNRSARLALLHYADGEKRYILWPEGLAVGTTVLSGEAADILPGNALPLKLIPVGTMIRSIERAAARAGRWCARRADRPARGQEGEYAQVKMPSGEIRRSRWSAWPPSANSATSSTERLHGKAGHKLAGRSRTTAGGHEPVDHPRRR